MLSITHSFVSAKADGTDTTVVRPSNWNAAHVVGGSVAFSELTGNIAVSQMAGGAGSSTTTFWRGDGTWAAPAGGAVSSVFGRTGAVVAASNDYSFAQLSGNIATTQMGSGTGASSTTFWRGDGTWAAPAGGAVSSVFGRTGVVVAAANDYSFTQLSGNIATVQMGSGIGASASTFWRGDGTWAAPAGGGGTPGGSSGQLQWNNVGAFGGMSGTSWDDANRTLTLTGATVTASQPVFDLSQTWNSGGVTFTGLRLNVARTAQAGGSALFELQFDGTPQLGLYTWGGTNNYLAFQNTVGGLVVGSGGSFVSGSSRQTCISSGSVNLASTNAFFGFQPGAATDNTPDVALFRDAAGVLALRGATAAQTFRVYNTYTDASNYERGVFDWTTNVNVLTIGAQAAGTGTLRRTVIIAGTKAGAPVAADIPSGTFAVIRDTTNSTTKLYYNNAGTLQSVALA